ncbi:MAG TPA: hypothetical protein VFT45_19400 [Longimicrobium sp.]|nr:hypothetical protein [Longimicrobium sp.]
MFQVIQLSQYSCPGLTSQWVRASAPSGTIVSVGFQNSGNAQNFWASQMFPLNAQQGYWQVNNTSLTSTEWWPYVVVFQDSGAAELSANDVRYETGTVPLGEGVRGPGSSNS